MGLAPLANTMKNPEQTATMSMVISFKDATLSQRIKNCLILLFGGGIDEKLTVTRQFLEDGIHKLDLEKII